MRSLMISLTLAATWLLSPLAFAQQGSDRVALVVGNSAYRMAPLFNPQNDAKAMAALLRTAGFSVDQQVDTSLEQLQKAVSQFGQKILDPKVKFAVFYYAGHGVQLDWRNYLVPVTATIRSSDDVRSQTVDVSSLLKYMGEAKNKNYIIILDACRDDPFAGTYRPPAKGLSQFDAPVGSVLAYSTSPGKVALDGEGSNGLYTAYLLKEFAVKGVKIEDAFKRTRLNVRLASNGAQVPWETTSLEEDLYLFPEARQHLTDAEQDKLLEAELQAWAKVKSTNDFLVLADFIRVYPSGSVSELAASRMNRLLATQQDRELRVVTAKSATLVQAEKDRVEREEALRVAAEKAEAARVAAAQAEAARQEALRAEAARQEALKLDAARAEAARVESQRQEAARVEAARLAAQRTEAARAAAQKAQEAQETLVAAARLAAEREAQARRDAEARIAQIQSEQARAEAARVEAARAEAARLAAVRLETERREAARVELARAEAQRLEAQRTALAADEETRRLQAQRLALEQAQTQKLATEREQALRLEALRVLAEREQAARQEAARVALVAEQAAKTQAEAARAALLLAQQQEAARPAPVVTAAAAVPIVVDLLTLPAEQIAATPFFTGATENLRRYSVGDEFSFRVIDQFTKAQTPLAMRVTALDVTNDQVEYNQGEYLSDLMGNILRNLRGASSTPRQFYPAEMVVGKRWQTQFKQVRPGAVTYTFRYDLKIVGKERVTVPAGTFDTFKIEARGYNVNLGARLERNIWIAPGVNADIAHETLVRLNNGRIEQNERQELVSLRQKAPVPATSLAGR